MPRFGLSYDLNFPHVASDLRSSFFHEALEQCSYADDHGFASLVLFEHHGTPGGYLPSPLIFAAAAAARTRRITIEPLLVAPFYEPLKLAEDLAICDLISDGRLRPTLGVGYRAEEFAMFGRDSRERRRALENMVGVLRRAWTGEPFEFEGRRVCVTPRPAQRPHPPIALGGNSAAAARSAARIGDRFRPMDQRWWAVYREECVALDKPDPGPPGAVLPAFFLHVTEDPERDLARLAPDLLAAIADYRDWTSGNANAVGLRASDRFHPRNVEELRAAAEYLIVTPDECVNVMRRLGPDASATVRPMWGGHEPELAWESLRLLTERVLPTLVGGSDQSAP